MEIEWTKKGSFLIITILDSFITIIHQEFKIIKGATVRKNFGKTLIARK